MDVTSSRQAREYTLLNTRSVTGNPRNECIELRVGCAEKGMTSGAEDVVKRD